MDNSSLFLLSLLKLIDDSSFPLRLTTPIVLEKSVDIICDLKEIQHPLELRNLLEALYDVTKCEVAIQRAEKSEQKSEFDLWPEEFEKRVIPLLGRQYNVPESAIANLRRFWEAFSIDSAIFLPEMITVHNRAILFQWIDEDMMVLFSEDALKATVHNLKSDEVSEVYSCETVEKMKATMKRILQS